jgi:hypothetical protein
MRLTIAAALALIATSLSAQTTQTVPDLSTAKPIDGSWSYAATSDGSEATFVNVGGAPQLWVSCTCSTRQVSIAKAATAAAPFIAVWTSSQSRSIPASFNPTTVRLTIQLGASDSLLDALSNSRARLGFTVGSEPPLVVPAWAEPARVIEDCRA